VGPRQARRPGAGRGRGRGPGERRHAGILLDDPGERRATPGQGAHRRPGSRRARHRRHAARAVPDRDVGPHPCGAACPARGTLWRVLGARPGRGLVRPRPTRALVVEPAAHGLARVAARRVRGAARGARGRRVDGPAAAGQRLDPATRVGGPASSPHQAELPVRGTGPTRPVRRWHAAEHGNRRGGGSARRGGRIPVPGQRRSGRLRDVRAAGSRYGRAADPPRVRPRRRRPALRHSARGSARPAGPGRR